MQVNSAQDYLTRYKNRVLAKGFVAIPAPQARRTNTLFTSVLANSAAQRERQVFPQASAAGSVPGGVSYTSDCCVSSLNLPVFIDNGFLRFNVIPPLS